MMAYWKPHRTAISASSTESTHSPGAGFKSSVSTFIVTVLCPDPAVRGALCLVDSASPPGLLFRLITARCTGNRRRRTTEIGSCGILIALDLRRLVPLRSGTQSAHLIAASVGFTSFFLIWISVIWGLILRNGWVSTRL